VGAAQARVTYDARSSVLRLIVHDDNLQIHALPRQRRDRYRQRLGLVSSRDQRSHIVQIGVVHWLFAIQGFTG
jgi:hypothetical protein